MLIQKIVFSSSLNPIKAKGQSQPELTILLRAFLIKKLKKILKMDGLDFLHNQKLKAFSKFMIQMSKRLISLKNMHDLYSENIGIN